MNLGKVKVFDFKLGDTLGVYWEEQIKIWQEEDEENIRVITSIQCIPNKTKYGDYMSIFLTYLEVPRIRRVSELAIRKQELRQIRIERDERNERIVSESVVDVASDVDESNGRVGLIFRNIEQ